MGVNQPKAIRDWTYKPVGGELLPDNLPGYARNLAESLNHVGGKLLPDSLSTKTSLPKKSACFLVGANQPKAIRDLAMTSPPCRCASASLPGYARLAIQFGYFKISDDSSSLSWTPFEFFQWINPFVFPPRTTLPAVLGEPNSTSLPNIK